MITIYGYNACECIQTLIPHVESDLIAAGIIKHDLSGLIMQGAYNTSVSASAGTHNGGGVWDLSIYDDKTLRIMRMWGWWASHRTTAQGFSADHNHAVVAGCPHLSPVAQQQVASFKAGKNGLANNGPDQNLGVSFRTFQEALAMYTTKPVAPAPAPAPTPTPTKTTVSLSRLLAAKKHDLAAPQGSTYSYADVFPVEQALMKEGLLAKGYSSDGYWGTLTTQGYAAWQRRLGYTLADADGNPGLTSLTKLGNKYGFTVVS